MNIYIPDLKGGHAFKYHNGEFIAVNMQDILIELLENRANDVRDIMEQNNELGVADKYLERCTNRLEHIDTENKKEIKNLKKEVKLQLFNSKNKILENKNKK
jgi:frataxin-like iron-binding protein CyaY